jgi:hypothetical protein
MPLQSLTPRLASLGLLPFPPIARSPGSTSMAGVHFTGRNRAYRAGDTWYPRWADDGNLYSAWTDGGLEGMVSGSSHGENAKTGHAVMIGDDPLSLEIHNTSPPKTASGLPYQGRYHELRVWEYRRRQAPADHPLSNGRRW